MAMDEKGEMESLSDAEAAALNELGGVSRSSYPFNNSFEIVFMAFYYAYNYGTDEQGALL